MQSAASTAGDGTTGEAAVFSYGALAVRVLAPRPQLRWLAEFLSPWFRVAPDGDHAAAVVLSENARRYGEIAAAWRRDDAVEMDCFVNDSHVVRLLAVGSEVGGVTVFDESLPVFYRADPEARALAIFSRGAGAAARTGLLRIVRELGMNHAQLHGGTFFHAAALARAGRVMLIAGEKHAGKTTLLLYLLREGRADFVSNDRVLLPQRTLASVRGMPTIVTVRAQTMTFVPTLEADPAARFYAYPRTLAEAVEQAWPVRPGRDGSRSLSPAQLCALLAVRPAAEGVPHVLLVPRITGEPNEGGLRDLAPAEAAACLRRAVLSAGMAKKTSDLVAFRDDPPPPAPEMLEETIRSVAARVHCVECRLGTRSYETGALAARCLALLTG